MKAIFDPHYDVRGWFDSTLTVSGWLDQELVDDGGAPPAAVTPLRMVMGMGLSLLLGMVLLGL